MTKEEHEKRHAFLHEALDELLADWIANHRHERTPLPELTVLELMEWNRKQKGQAINVDDEMPVEDVLQRCVEHLHGLNESEINSRVTTGHSVVILDAEDFQWVKNALLSLLDFITRGNEEKG